MLDLHRLRVYQAVVATGSITQAAANLGYTASAVSQHLAALQRETGLKLIERNGRGIEPTATGKLLAKESAAALEQFAALDSVVADLRHGRIGSLSVGYFASAGATWIPPIIATLACEFPDLRLRLRLLELAGDRPVDADVEVFVEGNATDPVRGYDVHRLIEEPYVAVVHQSHPLAGKDAVPLRDLAAEHWVDNDFSKGACRQSVLDACATVGFLPAFRIQTHDYPTAIAFVAAGMGITVLPRLGVATSLPDGVAVIPVVDPTPTRRISVRVRQTLRDNPAARRVLELLKERVGRGGGDAAPRLAG